MLPLLMKDFELRESPGNLLQAIQVVNLECYLYRILHIQLPQFFANKRK